jgi:hypothetical protein
MVLSGRGRGLHHVQAARASDGTFSFVYLPTGRPAEIDMTKLVGPRVAAHWFNPRAGSWSRIGDYAASRPREFTPPSTGRGNDWVLVLEAV